ncbi:MAG: DUF3575 domain-containing protein [Bacteroidia bacterium]|nr:DUF3575 domain-containing protein [Bacteroidia bacterium]
MHYRLACWVLILIPAFVYGQRQAHLSLNLAPLIMGTGELRGEWQLANSLSFEAALGMRWQGTQLSEPQLGALSQYIQPKNRGGFMSAGFRTFTKAANPYQYPFFAFNLTGVYYDEEIIVPDYTTGTYQIEAASGVRLGGSATLGFNLWISNRLNMDLALQMGYSKPREDLLAYYYPGMGYSTFGYGIIGVKGGHVQPVIALRYVIREDPRDKLRRME